MKKVFIDGEAGTTGLKIFKRLSSRHDIELLSLPSELRKDHDSIKIMLNSVDIAFLCLPDDAAREAVEMVSSPDTVIIDTSTAHRTAPGWSYGFPELSAEHMAAVKASKRISVPGCHASGFIALIYPLIEAGIMSPEIGLSCFSLTGYSGGGKKMIAEYESADKAVSLSAPRVYGIGQTHKHLIEMKIQSGLLNEPVFVPVVDDYFSGMLVTVPLTRTMLKSGTLEDIRKIYGEKYTGPVVKFIESIDDNGFISANTLSGSDRMNISVCGNNERFTLTAQFDNLGKGASGNAIECMNIVLGTAETAGLAID